METDLLETLSLAQSTKIIRAEVHQPKIRYHIIYIEPAVTSILRFTVDLAKLLTAEVLGTQKRGIIFCTSKGEANTISDLFTGCKSHSDVNREDRNHMEAQWFAGYKQWIAATTGMIHGVDHPNVGAIIFVGLPYGLINVYQGAGRGGRNGDPAVCITIAKVLPFVHVGKYLKDVECRLEGDKWVANREECRRLGLSQLMDGRPTDCSNLNGCEYCDICEPDTPLLRAIQSIIPDREVFPTSPITISAESSPVLLAVQMPQLQSIQTLCQNKTAISDDDYSWLNMNDDFIDDVDESCSQPGTSISHNIISTHGKIIDAEFALTGTHILPAINAPPLGDIQISQVHKVHTQIRPVIQSLTSTSVALQLGPPITNIPSMSVSLDVAALQLQRRQKYDKGRILSHMASFLLGKCVICWASRNLLTPIMPRHQPFIHCREQQQGFLDHALGWIAFKKKLHLPKYKYCYRCGTSQETQYQPTVHPIFKPGERMECPIEDFVVLLIWYIRHDKVIWSKAVEAFRATGLSFSLNNICFAQWCSSGDNDGSFYNGLELVMWLWVIKSSNN